MVKILYVCYFAHYSGHPPWAAKHEPKALEDTGAEVTLLTFCGLIKGMTPEVPNIQVCNDYKIFPLLRQYKLTRWLVMLIETAATIRKALRIRHNYDYLILRDGEPLIWLSHLLSLPYKNVKWIVTLMGSVICAPVLNGRGSLTWYMRTYTWFIKILNGKAWIPLYKASLKRNSFTYITQNEDIQEQYSKFLNGIFNGLVHSVPMGISPNSYKRVDKLIARRLLNLPEHKTILLSFGVPHPGKDIRVICEAISKMPDVFYLYAGIAKFSVGDNPRQLIREFKLENRSRIMDYYIPENTKVTVLSAVDACVLSYTNEFKCTASMLWETAKYHVPVIASRANSLGTLVQKYKLGVLFKNGDADSLMSAAKAVRHMNNYQYEQFNQEFSLEKWAKGLRTIAEAQE